MRTKHQAKKLARQLTDDGIPAVDLHGNLSQAARDRNLAAFSNGSARVLVATDVAARGVHVDGVELVVHVDPPAEHKAYLHRSGRTARAGNAGDVVTVVLPEQRKDLAVLMRRAAIAVKPQQVTSDSTQVRELVGETAAHVAPAPRDTAQESRDNAGAGRPQSRRGGRPHRTAQPSRGNASSAQRSRRASAGNHGGSGGGDLVAFSRAGGGRRSR
jgi:superfamily II DNA/RNA helicase